MANLLARETSPYLLQHKDNPVEWRPWGDAALGAAKAAGKPILLSVGYAACHWCHVMAHESFEDPETAAQMNDLFVNIKVDREERPDIDAIYQTALQMLGEQGGWPLTMFLTPAGEPFWGGTYFPPEPRYGRPAFREVLRGVAEAYRGQPDKIRQNSDALRDGLTRFYGAGGGGGAITIDQLDRAARQVLLAVDIVHGGLRGAPKFPQPFLFGFLWRAALRAKDERLREAVTLTLDHMSHGGIYDHLGGGFHRYSTDERWVVPHFEKMLYDNAALIDLLTLVWRGTGNALYARRVSETVEWALREMIGEGGAFAATLDADSESKEGTFYVWSHDEILRLMPNAKYAQAFKDAYDIRPEGNWEGNIILDRNKPQPAGGEGFEAILAECRAVLWRERERRVRPGRDDKILADWNGLMISAMANAAFVFEMPRWLDAARLAFDAVRDQLGLGDDRLAHSYRHGRRQDVAMLDDYAAMARAALTLFEVTGDIAYVEQAERWVATADRHYRDAAGGGYFFTADDATGLLLRTKSGLDTAVPSGNGLMAEVLAKLYHLTGRDHFRERAQRTIEAFSGQMSQQFPNMASLLGAFEILHGECLVVVVGDPAAEATRKLYRAVAESSLPTRILMPVRPGQELPVDHPAYGKTAVGGDAAAYVCSGQTCSPPTTSARVLRDRLTAR